MKHSMRLLLAPLCLLATPMTQSHADEGAAQQNAVPSPAVIKMRRQWLNPEINSFTFRDTARMFETRLVRHQGAVQPLPRAAGFTMPSLTVDGTSLAYNDVAERTYINAFLVIRDGKILFEDYRNRSDAQTHFISFSMAKSITSLLMGIALEKGLIKSLDDPVTAYLPELKGGGYDGVTLRHILQMRSGVDYDERYDFGDKPSPAAQNHENAIVQNKVRFADAARTIGHKWEQGSHFNYATIDTAVLGWTLERATKQPLATFTQANLWGPAGMEGDGYWIADGPPGVGRELSGMGYNALLRDYGRLGLLMLNGGKRGNRQIVPADWMRAATTMLPTGNAERPGYGLQFWQVDKEPGAFAAVGLAGQMIYVHPATKTVIVKLSYHPPVVPPAVNEETLRYFKAITDQR